MKYFKAFLNGDRSKSEYVVAIIISALMLLVTIVVMPIIIYSVKNVTIVNVWFVLIILTFLCAVPIGTTSVLMIMAKEKRQTERKKAEKKLTIDFRPFKYKAYTAGEFERRIIYGTPIRFEAKMDKKGLITIKALATDGGVVHTEETYDYKWFNENFYSDHHIF